MKVIYVTRPTVFSGPGGDTVQLLQTADFLQSRGVDVTIAEQSEPDFNGFDLVHFFNLRNPQDLLRNVRRAKRAGLPAVLSTIWGSYRECDVKTRKGIPGFLSRNLSEHRLEYLKALARTIRNGNFTKNMLPYFLKGHLSAQREIVQTVDVVLPNSPTELERVRADMQFPDKSGVVVANAVDLKVFDFDSVEIEERFHQYNGCILSAARVEPRKCQRELILAANKTEHQLVIVGKPSPNSRRYFDECQSVAGPNVHFIPHVEHHQLAQLYKIAKVHALISWMETPGLSSLEAGVMRCNLVVTNRGDTEYYFKDLVEYVEPDCVESIRNGLLTAMSSSFNPDLDSRIRENFTWDHTADQTLRAYQIALKGVPK